MKTPQVDALPGMTPLGVKPSLPYNEAEALADSILKAAGSNLKHYTMARTRDAIFAAAQAGIDKARAEADAELLAAFVVARDMLVQCMGQCLFTLGAQRNMLEIIELALAKFYKK